MRRLKAQNYVIEFMLLGLMGIMIFAGLFAFYRVALSPLYESNLDAQARFITLKLSYAYDVFSKYDVDEAEFKINIPKQINNKYYEIRKSIGGLIIVVDEDYLMFDLPFDYELDFTKSSIDGRLYLIYTDGTVRLR